MDQKKENRVLLPRALDRRELPVANSLDLRLELVNRRGVSLLQRAIGRVVPRLVELSGN